jgi:tRNA/rRNA methyltransferase
VHRLAIELVNARKRGVVADHAARKTRLESRDYHVLAVADADLERQLARLAAAISDRA